MKIKPLLVSSVLALSFAGCETSETKVVAVKTYPYFGMLDRLDPALDALIAPDARIEKLAEGFTWSEGPVWMKRGGFLVFSDVPQNVVHKWTERDGISDYLKPSGYTGSVPRGGEPGSNGLTVDSQGRLTLCEHGDRRVARLENDRTKTTLADRYQGKRFNSPNDLCYKSNGDLYFTDPPYGLLGDNHDVGKELSFQGVYRLSKSGQLILLTDKLTFPNGLAFSPDEKILYVAVSDPKLPYIWAFDVQSDGTIANGRKFFDATKFVAQGLKGLPDGMKVDVRGNLFATGPGGVLIISPEGKHLGTISTGEPTANCAWGEDGSMLYITCNHWLARIQTRTRGRMP